MSSRLTPAPWIRTIGGASAGAVPSSTTCWRKRRTLTRRPRGGCARPISHEPIAVTSAPSARMTITTASARITRKFLRRSATQGRRTSPRSQRLALEPARTLPIERVQVRPFEAGHVRPHLVADLGLQISQMPVAFRKTLEQILIERQLGRGIDRIETILFVNQPAQHQPPPGAAIFEESVESPGADHVADDAVDRGAL